jgi:thiosulfate reductase cytochrome b subunit
VLVAGLALTVEAEVLVADLIGEPNVHCAFVVALAALLLAYGAIEQVAAHTRETILAIQTSVTRSHA